MAALLSMLRTTHLRALSVALLATAFSAGLAFADEAPGPASAAGPGLENAATHAGKTVPVRGGDVTTDDEDDEDDEVDQDDEDEEEVGTEDEDGDGGENCATDPTTLTEEELAEMRHGSVVCWAAHQDPPEGYDNHGQWVSEWASSKAKGPKHELPAQAKAKGQSSRP